MEDFGKLANEAAGGLGGRNLINAGAAGECAESFAQDRLEGRGSDARREKAQGWSKTVFRRWLLKTAPVRELGESEALAFAEGKPWAMEALRAGRRLHEISFGQEQRDAYVAATDWLLGDAQLSERGDWSRIGVEQALAGHEKWIERMAAEEERKKEVADSNEGCERIGPEGEDGTFWVEVKSEAALKREGARMRHCVGGYGEAVAKGKVKIFSKRSEGGAKSLVTVELSDAPAASQEEEPAKGFSMAEAKARLKKGLGERVWKLEQAKRFANVLASGEDLPGVAWLCKEAEKQTGRRVVPGADAVALGMVDAMPVCGVEELAYPGMPRELKARVLDALRGNLMLPDSMGSQKNKAFLKNLMRLAKAVDGPEAQEVVSAVFRDRAGCLQGTACHELCGISWSSWGKWYAPGLGLETADSPRALEFLRGRIQKEASSMEAEEIRRAGSFLLRSAQGVAMLPMLAQCAQWRQACWGGGHDKGQAELFRSQMEASGIAPLPGFGPGVWLGAEGERAALEAIRAKLEGALEAGLVDVEIAPGAPAEKCASALSSLAYAAAGANEPALCSWAVGRLSGQPGSGGGAGADRARRLMERRGVWIAPSALGQLPVAMGKEADSEAALAEAWAGAAERAGKAPGRSEMFEAAQWLLDRGLRKAASKMCSGPWFAKACLREKAGGKTFSEGWSWEVDVFPEAKELCRRLGKETGKGMVPVPFFWQQGRVWSSEDGQEALSAAKELYGKRDRLSQSRMLEAAGYCKALGLGDAALWILDMEAARVADRAQAHAFAQELRSLSMGADCAWEVSVDGQGRCRVLSEDRRAGAGGSAAGDGHSNADAAWALSWGLAGAGEPGAAGRMGAMSLSARLLGRLGASGEFGELLGRAVDGEERMDLAKCALESSSAGAAAELSKCLAPEEMFRVYGYLMAVEREAQAGEVMEALANLADPSSEMGQLMAELAAAERSGAEAARSVAALRGKELKAADFLGNPLWTAHADAVCAMASPAAALAGAAAGYRELARLYGRPAPCREGRFDLETAQKSAWLQAFAQAGAENAGILGGLKSYALGDLARRGSYASEHVSAKDALSEAVIGAACPLSAADLSAAKPAGRAGARAGRR